MSDKAQRTIRIKWVRSGIGFTYHQKRIVRSLGLKKLNQEVERPDTPQIRGLVAKVPHLVKIVEAASKAAWTLVPEYTIYPPQALPAKPAETPLEAPAGESDDLAATKISGTADPSGDESARAGEEASPEEGQLKA